VSIMMDRSNRIEVEIDAESQALVAEAARLVGLPVHEFVARAARVTADDLLGRTDRIVLPADLFDELMADDEPEDAPNLTRAAARYRQLIGE
jgi:uncharacterized protein (DUF1778 family)